tara:strand:- start:301 stop:630 length:330 start_codon:yes stop_codon:yes gene_type:complete
MGVSTEYLMREKYALNKSFGDLKTKIETVEKEVATMRNNLNALNGAIQIVDKMISSDDNFDKNTGQLNMPTDGGNNWSKERLDKDNVKARQKELEIEETKKELLNEGDK